MPVLFRAQALRGMSLMDVLVGSALTLIVFLALFGLIRASLIISSSAKAKAGAVAVATSQMEYLRSLPYSSLGTVAGIPSGTVPQYATTTLNGIEYGVRTFIAYADDVADGSGGADTNGITTDYKRAKVVVSYVLPDRVRTVSLVSNQSPPGVESTTGGGTLRLEVTDAGGLPVSGATVRVVNASTTPTVDVSTLSDATGTVLFSGAATSTEYQVYVSRSGYSFAQTYPRDGVNVNPTPGYLTVAEAQTTTQAFRIDALASLTIRTFSPPTPGAFSDSFNDLSGLESQTDTQVSSGSLILSGSPGTYVASGNAKSANVLPAALSSWGEVSATLATTTPTTVLVQVTDGTGLLVSDTDLPGNSAGFTTFPVSLAGLSTTTYPVLALRAALTSSDVMETPSISEWSLTYSVGKTPLPNVPLTLTGGKTIGSDALGDPIYKTIVATTTDSSGVRTLSLEWDVYQLLVSGYTVTTASPVPPYDILPATTQDAELELSP